LFPATTAFTNLTSLTLAVNYEVLHEAIDPVALPHLRTLCFVFEFRSVPHEHAVCPDVLAPMTLPALAAVDVVEEWPGGAGGDAFLRPFASARTRGILRSHSLRDASESSMDEVFEL
jgi:hypothetical protein